MKITVASPIDFDFRQCLDAHGWKSLAPFTWDPDCFVLTRIEQYNDCGTAELRLSSVDNHIIVESDHDLPEPAVRRQVELMFQLNLPMREFHEYCRDIDPLAHVPKVKQGRLLRSPTVFEDVIKVIATTNTTWGQTKGMVARIVNSFGPPLPSDHKHHAFPTPAQIAAVSLDEFAEQARMGYRNASVHKIAVEVAEGRLDLESWNDRSITTEDLYKRLLSLPGIGPYAASCLLIYLGKYDRVNADSWARTLVGRELGRKVTDKEVHQFFAPHGKWQALAYHFYSWKPDDPL